MDAPAISAFSVDLIINTLTPGLGNRTLSYQFIKYTG